MVHAWCKAKIGISDLPTMSPGPWPYLYDRRKGLRGESSMS